MTERDMIIYDGIDEHYDEALKYFDKPQIVGLFLQGSQNYRLDIPGQSDIDSKLIVVPSFKDIALNAKPISTTHIRENNEHIDFKDVRLYFDLFRKQNLNFLEILYTPYCVINLPYCDEWIKLCKHREEITHMNPYRAVKSMKGIALEKYHAMEHPYPSKIEILTKYGYDPKQLHHLVRVDAYLEKYINGAKYQDCLILPNDIRQYLIDIKMGCYELEEARDIANTTINHITEIADKFCNQVPDEENKDTVELLQNVQYNIMKIAIREELKNE